MNWQPQKYSTVKDAHVFAGFPIKKFLREFQSRLWYTNNTIPQAVLWATWRKMQERCRVLADYMPWCHPAAIGAERNNGVPRLWQGLSGAVLGGRSWYIENRLEIFEYRFDIKEFDRRGNAPIHFGIRDAVGGDTQDSVACQEGWVEFGVQPEDGNIDDPCDWVWMQIQRRGGNSSILSKRGGIEKGQDRQFNLDLCRWCRMIQKKWLGWKAWRGRRGTLYDRCWFSR